MEADKQREMKFRAWDRKNKHFATCRNGGKTLSCSLSYKGIQSLGRPSYYVIQQYTGLKDKNGKEIYEGDICRKDSLEPIEIIWGRTGWLTRYFAEGSIVTDVFLNGLEIIGNIYENPELLVPNTK